MCYGNSWTTLWSQDESCIMVPAQPVIYCVCTLDSGVQQSNHIIAMTLDNALQSSQG